MLCHSAASLSLQSWQLPALPVCSRCTLAACVPAPAVTPTPTGKVQGAAESAAGTVSHYAHQPGTSGAGEGVGVKTPAPYVTSGGAARRVPVAVPVTTTIGGGAGAY